MAFRLSFCIQLRRTPLLHVALALTLHRAINAIGVMAFALADLNSSIVHQALTS
jgi:hypothetical protein